MIYVCKQSIFSILKIKIIIFIDYLKFLKRFRIDIKSENEQNIWTI